MEAVNQAPPAATGLSAGLSNPAKEVFHETRSGWLVLAVVWAASAAYLGLYLREAAVPHDAGMLAQMAERVLRGQVPYRDFIDVYTGGLDYLNALAFRLAGVNFLSLRIPLFLFFLGWVPSLYLIARRFARPFGAALVALLGVVWSVPNYPEAMPSWYNLFFATWGTLALLRHAETKRSRWLWIAGLCGGLSFLAKISGLYFVAAALLFFVFRELSLAPLGKTERKRDAMLYRLFVTAGLLLYLASLTWLVAAQPTIRELVYFVLPSASLVALLLLGTWGRAGLGGAARFRALFGMAIPFLAGALAAVVPFLLWLASQGALAAWFRGVFVLPARRTGWAAYTPPSLVLTLALIPLLLVLFPPHPETRMTRASAVGGVIALTAILVASRYSIAIYGIIGLVPMLFVPAAALGLLLWLRGAPSPLKQEKVFLVVSVATVCSLIEFPFAMSTYFCYVAPLVIIAVAALSSNVPKARPAVLGALALFYLAFGLWLRAPAYYTAMDVKPLQPPQFRPLRLSRAGGLLVRTSQANVYERLVPLVRAHARGGYIYCTPDCPEVYFLTGKLNPTGTIYDFLDPDFFNPVGRADRILNAIQQHKVNVVVLAPPDFTDSGALAPVLLQPLDRRFPDSEIVGRFQVRWKP